jgi:hypothetical protein
MAKPKRQQVAALCHKLSPKYAKFEFFWMKNYSPPILK